MEPKAKEIMSAAFALTESNDQERTFRGIASVFGSLVDTWIPTIIDAGAFKKTLSENGSRVKILFNHDAMEPIGKPMAMAETAVGLEVYGKISDTECGRDCMTLMKDGVLDELSIGFDPIKWEMVESAGMSGEKTMIRHVKECRLWEFSLVPFAADPNARIQSVHALVRAVPKSLQSIFAPLSGMQLEAEEIALLELLADPSVPREAHEGKMLSGKNKKLIADCVSALQALLTAAEPPAKEDDQALTVNMERLNRLRNAELALASLQLNS